MSRLKHITETRFGYLEEQVLNPPSDDSCQLWPFARGKRGYGNVWFPALRKTMLVHQVAYHIVTGHAPTAHLLHKCDTPACFRFSHLREGSQADNLADMSAKNRNRKGEQHTLAKLTADDVRQIRHLYDIQHISRPELAQRFGVSRALIHKVVMRQSWKHVED